VVVVVVAFVFVFPERKRSFSSISFNNKIHFSLKD
jgi:hypothetical protein